MPIVDDPQILQTLINAGLPAKRAFIETFTDGNPQQVHAEFSRGLTQEENIIFLGLTNPAKMRKLQAKVQAQAIPSWATWTEQEALVWLQTNIGDPLNTPIPANPMTVQQIRAVLVVIIDTMKKQYDAEKAMARMIIALRNETWSDLPE